MAKSKSLKSVRKFKVGLKQIIIEMITGLATTLVLSLLGYFGYISDSLDLFVNIFLIVSNILLAWSMLSWGMFYTIGWLVGSFIFFEIGLFGTGDFILYFVLPLIVLAARIILTIRKSMAS